MARIEVVRHVAADPAGVALLLAGPAGRDLWGEESVAMTPPQRAGVGFRVDLQLAERGPARGRILIVAGPSEVADPPAGVVPQATEMRLSISVAAADAPVVGARARRFLDGLAEAAQARSSAA